MRRLSFVRGTWYLLSRLLHTFLSLLLENISMSCGFVGNTDILGIGIRIGYYAQAIAVWFSNYFLYREAKALQATNNLFLLALTIAATIYFINTPTIHVIEAFLMLQIGLVIGLVGITEGSRYSSNYIKTSNERLILRTVIIMAGGLFNVCFWWKEVDRMLPTPCNNLVSGQGGRDKTYIFYVVKANIYGWVGILMKVQSLAAVVWTAPRIITFDVVVLFYNIRMRRAQAAFISAIESSLLIHGHNRRSSPERLRRQSSRGQCLPAQCLPALNEPQASSSITLFKNSTQAKPLRPLEDGKDNTTVSHRVEIGEDLKLLRDIDHATRYMEDLLSIYPTNTPPTEKKRLIRLCGLISLYLPQHKSHRTDTSTPYLHCCRTMLNSYFTNEPPFHLRWRLAIHMTASGQHSAWRWPHLLHRMYTLSQASPPPHWKHVTIASDILLTQTPLVVTTRSWMLTAAYQFLFIALLILQVELTIAWNHVSGLNELSSLGQLISCILGVGGLIKVLWVKWRLVGKGAEDAGPARGGGYEDAMAVYLERKRGVGGRGFVRATTA